MRSLLLASVAVCFTAGAAMAQSSMASPAPTGAPPNGMTTTKPVYSGQNSIKTITTPAPAQAMSASTMSAPAPMHTAMGSGHSMAMPADADAKTYLHIAATAIKNHDKALAEEALSHAETRLLTRAVPAAAAATPDDSTAVTAIEHARQALMSGDYSTAASDTRMAMHAHHGMGMSPMAGSGDIGGPSQ